MSIGVCSPGFDMVGIWKKFIKGFDPLLFDRTVYSGLSAFVIWIFIECRRSFLENLV